MVKAGHMSFFSIPKEKIQENKMEIKDLGKYRKENTKKGQWLDNLQKFN